MNRSTVMIHRYCAQVFDICAFPLFCQWTCLSRWPIALVQSDGHDHSNSAICLSLHRGNDLTIQASSLTLSKYESILYMQTFKFPFQIGHLIALHIIHECIFLSICLQFWLCKCAGVQASEITLKRCFTNEHVKLTNILIDYLCALTLSIWHQKGHAVCESTAVSIFTGNSHWLTDVYMTELFTFDWLMCGMHLLHQWMM